MINIAILLTLALTQSHGTSTEEPSAPPFRFHSALEPATIDPRGWLEASGGFMNVNLFRALYQIGPNGELLPDLAKSCAWDKIRNAHILRCQLRPNISSSQNRLIKAEDFVRSWLRLLKRDNLSTHVEIFESISGVTEYLKGQGDLNQIGLRALDDATLEIRLRRADPEFLWNLALPVTTPSYAEEDDFSDPQKIHFTGPYKIERWIKKNRVSLVENPFYWQPGPRPPVEILFVDDDNTALSMFELGKIDFLRRLNFKEMPRFQSSPGFQLKKMARFDVVGFSGALESEPHLREALTRSLDYKGLTRLLKLPTQLGCPSTFREWSKPYPCYQYDLNRARRALKRVKSQGLKNTLVLGFSKLAGEDVARAMEWMQDQWRQNLGLRVELRPMDTKMLLSEVQNRNIPIFHRGVNLTRPTCTAALELFVDENPRALLTLKHRSFDRLVQRLREAKSSNLRRELCGRALKILLDANLFVPLGEVYFASLKNDRFDGLRLTPINQLDLSLLQGRPMAH